MAIFQQRRDLSKEGFTEPVVLPNSSRITIEISSTAPLMPVTVATASQFSSPSKYHVLGSSPRRVAKKVLSSILSRHLLRITNRNDIDFCLVDDPHRVERNPQVRGDDSMTSLVDGLVIDETEHVAGRGLGVG